ncbi:MAG: rhomboid family intramembrane serine protease, partial [Burkholderiaceae bacterium]
MRTSPSVALFYIIVVTVTVQFLAPVQFAKYDRVLVLEGEVWRLVTGVWVHLSWAHLTMNLVGLALVLVLFKKSVRPLAV